MRVRQVDRHFRSPLLHYFIGETGFINDGNHTLCSTNHFPDTQRNAIIIQSNQRSILRTGEKINKHMHAFTGNLHWNSSTNKQHSHNDISVTRSGLFDLNHLHDLNHSEKNYLFKIF